jgi:hypothetical protein
VEAIEDEGRLAWSRTSFCGNDFRIVPMRVSEAQFWYSSHHSLTQNSILSTDIYRIKQGDTIAFLCLSVVCAAGFILWMHYQVKWDRPALIPNSLWKNLTFSSMCATITLSFAVITCLELFASLLYVHPTSP